MIHKSTFLAQYIYAWRALFWLNTFMLEEHIFGSTHLSLKEHFFGSKFLNHFTVLIRNAFDKHNYLAEPMREPFWFNHGSGKQIWPIGRILGQ